jgi:hypothetical protein
MVQLNIIGEKGYLWQAGCAKNTLLNGITLTFSFLSHRGRGKQEERRKGDIFTRNKPLENNFKDSLFVFLQKFFPAL